MEIVNRLKLIVIIGFFTIFLLPIQALAIPLTLSEKCTEGSAINTCVTVKVEKEAAIDKQVNLFNFYNTYPVGIQGTNRWATSYTRKDDNYYYYSVSISRFARDDTFTMYYYQNDRGTFREVKNRSVSISGRTTQFIVGSAGLPSLPKSFPVTHTPTTTPTTPTTTPTTPTTTGAIAATPQSTATSGTSFSAMGLDKGQCPVINGVESKVFTRGILKDIPCKGSVDSLEEVLTIIRNLVMGFILPAVGTIFTIMMIVGGILYITSRGNEKQSTKAKQTLTAAIIGLLIVILSYTIIVIFVGVIGGGIA